MAARQARVTDVVCAVLADFTTDFALANLVCICVPQGRKFSTMTGAATAAMAFARAQETWLQHSVCLALRWKAGFQFYAASNERRC